jgi:LmbE family N-acetylglucosaminyl deacetylase
MSPAHATRRAFVAGSAISVTATLLPDPSLADAEHQPKEAGRPLSVVCVGAHPDDPESGCGGTLARYARAGHHVTVIYLTRGERGIEGKSLDEAAAIRTAEAEAACRILDAKPLFAGQIDGATEVNPGRAAALRDLLLAQRPDLVFTHWPLDTHPDHQVAVLLTLRAYLAARPRFPLFFFEVNAGSQTFGFTPTDHLDITAVREQKKVALFAHKSQNGEEIYARHHQAMEQFRGRELGVPAAEAFVRLARDTRLPGMG